MTSRICCGGGGGMGARLLTVDLGPLNKGNGMGLKYFLYSENQFSHSTFPRGDIQTFFGPYFSVIFIGHDYLHQKEKGEGAVVKGSSWILPILTLDYVEVDESEIVKEGLFVASLAKAKSSYTHIQVKVVICLSLKHCPLPFSSDCFSHTVGSFLALVILLCVCESGYT